MKTVLPLIWIVSIGILLVLAGRLNGESDHFFGIADQSEQTVSFGHPVEIVAIHAVEAEQIKRGTRMLTLRRPDLSAHLTAIDDQIRAASARHDDQISNLESRLKEKSAERRAELAELDREIQSLQSRRTLNLKMLAEISGEETPKGNSPLSTELDALLIQRRHLDTSLKAQLEGLKDRLAQDIHPHEALVAELTNRKLELERQVNDLSVRARFDGRVGSIAVKPGEQVAPFKPIMTVHAQSPHFIMGYINENVHNAVTVGQRVWVYAQRPQHDERGIEAIVESLGSRIVEYPERLKRHTQVQAWGREAVVRLPPASDLLLGEKVLVSMRPPQAPSEMLDSIARFFGAGLGRAFAHAEPATTAPPLNSDLDQLDIRDVEPSAIVVQPNAEHYFIVSDEQIAGQSELLSMTHQGRIVHRHPLLGGPEIDDIESLSRQGQNYYLMASLSHRRNGERPASRCQLIEARQQAQAFRVQRSVNLCERLDQLGEKSNPAVQRLLGLAKVQRNLDVEAHALRNGVLYLGLKNPLDEAGRSVILQVGSIDQILDGQETELSIWRRVLLRLPDAQAAMRISDMVFQAGRLLILATGRVDGQPYSSLWSLASGQSKPTLIKKMPGLKAEGMSDVPVNKRLMLVFDNGSGRVPQYLAVAQP